jgi:hypothetical protein
MQETLIENQQTISYSLEKIQDSISPSKSLHQ